MAKKRATKATRRASKAKKVKAATQSLRESQRSLFDLRTGKPLPHAVSKVGKVSAVDWLRREKEEQNDKLRSDEYRLRRRARLAMRARVGVEKLPKALQDWLLSIDGPKVHGPISRKDVNEVLRWHDVRLDARACDALQDWAEHWYLQGCYQGYIEGRVEQLEERRSVSDKRIRRLRDKPVKPRDGDSDGTPPESVAKMDERDAEIYVDLPRLKRRHDAATAEATLAEKWGITDRRVRGIFLEQTVLRDYAASVRRGLGDVAATVEVVRRHGVESDGKPSQKRQAKVRAILDKARVRTLPEIH